MTNETETPRRSAVVTGSNRGIGRAVAEELARAGFDVCVNCSSERGLDEARAFAAALEADCGVPARGPPPGRTPPRPLRSSTPPRKRSAAWTCW